jgi:DNA-binding NarL/FixJ family response regulator
MVDAFFLIFIISASGPRRQGISAMIRCIPEAKIIYTVDDFRDVLRLIDITRNQAPIIVIDARSVNGEIESALELLKLKAPDSRCILLVEQPKDQEAFQNAGADAVLLEGFSDKQFRVASQSCLS